MKSQLKLIVLKMDAEKLEILIIKSNLNKTHNKIHR